MPPRQGAQAERRALDRLRALQLSPAQQADFALELLRDSNSTEVLQAACRVLAEHPRQEAHDPLVARYQQIAGDGRRRDAGGFLRAAILSALQPVVLPEDLALLESAANVREPSPNDAGAPAVLRAAALVALLDLDPNVAAYHAAAHLGDAGRMSGEPAITAARVLAAAGNEPALVAYVLLRGEPHPEVLAECLRQLRELPDGVLEQVIERALADGRDVVQLGLCDLLVHHRPTPVTQAAAARFLETTADLDLYQYLVATLVAERSPEHLALLEHEVASQTRREQLKVLRDCLDVRRGDPAVDGMLTSLDRRD